MGASILRNDCIGVNKSRSNRSDIAQPFNNATSVRLSIKRGEVPLNSTFGRLTTIGSAFMLELRNGRPHSWVVAECECGSVGCYCVAKLRHGHTSSCGCLMRERVSAINLQHGLSDHPLHRVLMSMIDRCGRKKSAAWPRYGGRGITVCQEWKDSFPAFLEWSLSHGWKPGLEIDRRDNDGNYEPSNCRYITRKEQMSNVSTNRFITACGERKTLTQWAEDDRCTVTEAGIRRRLGLGWSEQDAVMKPNRFKLGITLNERTVSE